MSKKEREYANSKWFDEFVCLCSNLSNDDNFSLKARSENGYGF